MLGICISIFFLVEWQVIQFTSKSIPFNKIQYFVYMIDELVHIFRIKFHI